MTQTLLSMTQEILDGIGGDEVNSINDTEESDIISKIIRSTYKAMSSNTSWQHTRRAIALTPRSDTNFPTHMLLNEDVKELLTVHYNTAKVGETRKQYVRIDYSDPDDFLRKTNNRNNDNPNVDVIIDDSGIELMIYNDKAPKFFTAFDDKNLIFDGYDAGVDATLQESKFQAQGFIIPAFTLSDSFVPDLPVDAFTMLIQESLKTAQWRLRQIQDVVADKEATKQSRWLSRKSWSVNGGIKYPNHGRR